jgi:hypothetical protein
VAVTRLVHPALFGLANRQAYFRKALSIFSTPAEALRPVGNAAAAFTRSDAPVTSKTAVDAAGEQPEPSGPQWVARFPTSLSISDLEPTFAANVTRFIEALRAASAVVRISATYRPQERAYLMHWAWEIGINLFDPSAVPPLTSVPIRWAHPELARSRLAAQQMVTAYGMVSNAALNSRHSDRLAIDMTISWNESLSIKEHDGKLRQIESQPRNGSNAELIIVGANYGVIKLPTDPPHWSDDGR